MITIQKLIYRLNGLHLLILERLEKAGFGGKAVLV
jgi:hypothetical protein